MYALLLVAAAAAQSPIPVEDFFRNDEFTDVSISPDGRHLSVTARVSRDARARNLVIMPLDGQSQARAVTGYTDADVRWHDWVSNDRVTFKVDRDYEAVNQFSEYLGFYSVRIDGKKGRNIHEPFRRDRRSLGDSVSVGGGAQGGRRETIQVVDRLPSDHRYIVVAEYEDGRTLPDACLLNVRTGGMRKVARNHANVFQWGADNEGEVRYALGRGTDEGRDDLVYEFLYRSDEKSDWRVLMRFHGDSVRVHGFDRDNRHLWVSSRVDQDRYALYRYDPQTESLGDPVHEDPVYDVTEDNAQGLVHAHDGRPLYFEYMAEKPVKVFLDDEWRREQALIDEALPDTVNSLVDWDDAERLFVVKAWSDRHKGDYYLYDREKRNLSFLLSAAGWLDPAAMASMHPVEFEARDGTPLRGYMTLPPGYREGLLPLIIHPHGGPYGIRDAWRFNEDVQFLASRGYAVLQVNYRGSGGYGHTFQRIGYGRWGMDMQDDLSDAVAWAVDMNVADPERVCIYGASYGGYATMAGLTLTPELYACGINYVGVVDLNLLHRYDTDFSGTAGRSEWFSRWWSERIGDPRLAKERFYHTSPINFIDKIQAPVMVVHGQYDGRVDIEQYRRLVTALEKHDKVYEAMVKRFEGHGFFKEQNQVELYTAIEAFLARHNPPRADGMTADSGP